MPSVDIIVSGGMETSNPGEGLVLDYDKAGTEVRLSLDDNSGITSYLWTIVYQPEDADVSLVNDSSAECYFISAPEKSGTYLLQCSVNDGEAVGTSGIAFLTPNIEVRKPAVGEFSEFAELGWVDSLHNFMDVVDARDPLYSNRWVENLSALRVTRVDEVDVETIFLLGRAERLDGGEGWFIWDSTSTENDNGGTIIKVDDVDIGRWKRVYSGSVESISDLRDYEFLPRQEIVTYVRGYYEEGDGGGGEFYWDSTSTETDNDGTIIQVTGVTTGRWKRQYSGAVNVKWFGAKGDGVTDDSAAIQNACDYVTSTGKLLRDDPDRSTLKLIFPSGSTYYLGTTISFSMPFWTTVEAGGAIFTSDQDQIMFNINPEANFTDYLTVAATTKQFCTWTGGVFHSTAGTKTASVGIKCPLFRNLKITRARFKNLWKGIEFIGTDSYIFSDCFFYVNTYSIYHPSGIIPGPATGSHPIGVTISRCSFNEDGIAGIFINERYNSINIRENVFAGYDCKVHLINPHATLPARGVTIRDNWFELNDGTTAEVIIDGGTGGTHGVVFDRNSFAESGVGWKGIECKNVEGLDITGTLFSDSSGGGTEVAIILDSDVKKVNISPSTVFVNVANTLQLGSSFNANELVGGVDVRLFGAKGDGVTDDTTAIQAAIAAVGSGDGTVLFGPGTYMINDYLYLSSKSNIKFIGRGPEKTTIKFMNSSNPNAAFYLANCQDIEIRDLTIDGNKANTAAASSTQRGIFLYSNTTDGNTGIVVDNVVIKNTKEDSIRGAGSTGGSAVSRPINMKISNCSLSNPGTIGIRVTGGTNNTTPPEIKVKDTVISGSAEHNIYFHTTTNCMVDGCTSLSTVDGNGIHFEESDLFTVSNCIVDDIQNVTNFGHGIVASQGTSDFTIVGNRVSNCEEAGIILDPTETGDDDYECHELRATITGNICKGNTGSNGIYVNHGTYVTITGNVCTGNLNGIGVLGNYNIITGNIARSNTQNGINLYQETDTGIGYFGCKISNNISEGNTSSDYQFNHTGWYYIGSRLVCGNYDFDYLGGSQGTFNLGELPDDATITRAWYEVISAFTSGGSATVAFGVATDDTTGLKAATAYNDTDYGVGFHDFDPDGSAANFTTLTTAARNVIMTVAGADLTAGQVKIFFEYTVNDRGN